MTGKIRSTLILSLSSTLILVVLIGGYILYRWVGPSARRSANVIAWIKDPAAHADWAIHAGQRCPRAPFVLPTDGFIGYLWLDTFKIGHRHEGIDIFGGSEVNQTPVVAAYSGYLTRLPDWKSTIIIRIPDDPLSPRRQIWTYYTHMADPQGHSFVSEKFPPGTTEMYVDAGALLGRQGNYSGDPASPVGVHLHFSIVKDNGQGKFLNELDAANTLDPSPYLGLPLNVNTNNGEIPVCK
jgi:hypothetical protein